MVKVQDHQGIQDKPEAPEELGGGCLRTWLMKRLMKKNGFKSSPRKFPLNLTWQISLLLQSSVMVQQRSSFCFFSGNEIHIRWREGAIIIKKSCRNDDENHKHSLCVLVVFSVFLWKKKKRENRNNDLRALVSSHLNRLYLSLGAECQKKSSPLKTHRGSM